MHLTLATPRMIRSRRRPRAELPRRGARMLAAGGAGAAFAFLFDPDQGRRRRHMLRDRAVAAVRRGSRQASRQAGYAGSLAGGMVRRGGAALSHHERSYDDVTLARKVETELFRPADVPKGSINVNARDGVVELRGEVPSPEQVEALGTAAARIEGVRHVHNLLHTPGAPAKHAPPSDPADVRERAAHGGA